MVGDLRQTLRVALPHGSPLAPEIWERRHRGIVVLLWVHAVGVAAFGMARGATFWHSITQGAIPAVPAERTCPCATALAGTGNG